MISLWLARMLASHLLWSYHSQRYYSAMCAYKVNTLCIHIAYIITRILLCDDIRTMCTECVCILITQHENILQDHFTFSFHHRENILDSTHRVNYIAYTHRRVISL